MVQIRIPVRYTKVYKICEIFSAIKPICRSHFYNIPRPNFGNLILLIFEMLFIYFILFILKTFANKDKLTGDNAIGRRSPLQGLTP